MISVKNLVKAYGNNQPAVKGVTFDITKGEIVGLLGPNGAGKTTIMRNFNMLYVSYIRRGIH